MISKKVLIVAAIVVIITIAFSSCTTRRIGCPVSAASGFGPGRIR